MAGDHLKRAATAVAVLALLATAGAAWADPIIKSGRFAGAKVDYEVVLPPGYQPDKAYPLVLVFTGGGQSLKAAQATVEADWRAEAEKRGYVLISPAAPDGQLFFQEGDRIFPAFLDMIRKDYKIVGKIHIAGHSNGGLSAFHIAAKYPAYFSTVTGYPGMLDEEERMSALKSMCLSMHVGDKDPDWGNAMQAEAGRMKAMGYRIAITVEKNQTHRIKAAEVDLSRRLFDEIESCK